MAQILKELSNASVFGYCQSFLGILPAFAGSLKRLVAINDALTVLIDDLDRRYDQSFLNKTHSYRYRPKFH